MKRDRRTITIPYQDYRSELKSEFTKGFNGGFNDGFRKALALVKTFYCEEDKEIKYFDRLPKDVQKMLLHMKGKGK